MQGPHSFPSYVSVCLCVCVWQWKTYQSRSSPFPARYINGRALHTRDVCATYSTVRKKTFQLLDHFLLFHLPLRFCCCVVYTARLFTNDLLFDLFLPLSPPLSFCRPLIYPSILPSLCICFFCFFLYAVWRWLRVMKHWTWMILYGPDRFYSLLPRTDSFSQPWLNRVCPVFFLLHRSQT